MSETTQEQNPTPDAAGQPVPPAEGETGTPAPPAGDGGGEAQQGGAHAAGEVSTDASGQVQSGEGTGGTPMDPPQPGADADGFGGDAPEQEGEDTAETDISGVGELPPNVRPGAVSGLDHQPLDGSGTDAADDGAAAESGETPQD
jgi:hypothetical protein